MSESIDYRWQLKAQRRRQAYLDRISETTIRFRDRYARKIDDLASQGLEEYARGEFASIRQSLRQLDSLANSDPEAARNLSFEIRASLSQLPSLARSARREFEARERQRRAELAEARRQATSDLALFLNELMAKVNDPIALDFAYDELRAVQAKYADRTVDASELAHIKSQVEKDVSAILTAAQVQADRWRDSKKAETAQQASTELIELYKESASGGLGGNTAALETLIAGLDALASTSSGKTRVDDIRQRVEELSTAAEQTAVDEECRRIVVRSIMESLQKTGFVVAKPKMHRDEIDEVVIRARKPSGPEASFRVQADGSMIYKFDHYEGMECKNDIDKVLPLLRDVYGVDLSDERVLWQNPDKISRDAKPMDGDAKEDRHG